MEGMNYEPYGGLVNQHHQVFQNNNNVNINTSVSVLPSYNEITNHQHIPNQISHNNIPKPQGNQYNNLDNNTSNKIVNINEIPYDINDTYIYENVNQSSNTNQINSSNSHEFQQWYKNTSYFKYPYFFKQDSEEIYLFDETKVDHFTKINNSSKFYFPRYSRATELIDGSFLISGGDFKNETTNICSHLILDSNGTSYNLRDSMKSSRKSHAHIYNGGFVYVFGGFGYYHKPINSVERFDTRNGGWKTLNPMNFNRAYGTAMNYDDNFIFIIGGLSDERREGTIDLNIIERYDIKNDVFSQFKIKLPIPVFGCITAMVASNLIFIAGGWSEESKISTRFAYTLNLSTGETNYLPPLARDGWSVLPPYYNSEIQCFDIFFTGEEVYGFPFHLKYAISISKNK
jgi:hypothetical protein